VQASTPAEAISALKLIPAFDPRRGKRYQVAIDGIQSRDALYDRYDGQELHLRPVMAGSGGNGWVNILIGSIEVIVGALIVIFGWWNGTGETIGFGLIMSGIAAIAGGVIQLLSPQPDFSAPNSQNQQSQYLNGTKNTVAIGTRIPMIYGRFKAYGQFISFNVGAGDLNAAPASWYSSPFTDFGELTNSAAPPLALDTDTATALVQLTSITAEGAVSESSELMVLNFTPAIPLPMAEYVIEFETGQVIHAECIDATDTVSRLMVLGGLTENVPDPGTYMVINQYLDGSAGFLTRTALDRMRGNIGGTQNYVDAPGMTT
jgi:predicted phage tail protein